MTSPVGDDDVQTSRLRHGAFVAVSFVVAVVVAGFFAWLGSKVTPAGWPLAALAVLYAAGAVLYRYESRLPGPASRVLALLAEYYPPISWLAKLEDVRIANATLVKDFDLTLREYALGALSDPDSRKLAARGRILTIRHVARRVAKCVPAPLSADALELLYRERCGQPTLTLWQSKKGAVLEEVAPILHRSERMPDPSPDYPFTQEEVSELLRGLRDFDVDFLAQELRILGDLGQRLTRYQRFLGDEEVPVRAPDLAGLAKSVHEQAGLPAGPSTLFRLEGAAATRALMDRVDGSENGDALSAVHLGVFLAERDTGAALLKEQACSLVSRWDANDPRNPVQILHAYLWEKDRRGIDEASVTLAELDRGWSDWASDAEASLDRDGSDGYKQDLGLLRARLDSGHWPIRRMDYYGRPSFPSAVHAPRDGHDEVRDLDAYLITFDERSGPVARLVDSVKKRPHGEQTYRFGPYTRNTRLGLLPSGMPFHEFVEQFFRDLDAVLRTYAPYPPLDVEPNGVLPVVEGQQRNIQLRHDKPCAGQVEFRITREPKPGEGRLGPILRIDSQHALVTYFPESGPVSAAKKVGFEYESGCGNSTKSHSVELLVEPRGQEQPLDRIEVTVNRIDLAHCRELWFGDKALGSKTRPPSIYDVWDTIEPQLGRDEAPVIKEVFDRIAGGHGRP